jgi:hypothetical protein
MERVIFAFYIVLKTAWYLERFLALPKLAIVVKTLVVEGAAAHQKTALRALLLSTGTIETGLGFRARARSIRQHQNPSQHQ